MITRTLILTILLAVASPRAFADYSIVQELSGTTCRVTEGRPAPRAGIMIFPFLYKTRAEAEQAAFHCSERL